MPARVLRKVQLTGGSTLIVSLPKEWVKNVGISPGDYVVIEQQPDNSLRILPSKFVRKGPYEVDMIIKKDMTPSMIMREFISRYLAGYDVIRVKFEDSAYKSKDIIRDIMQRKVIGMEVIEEKANELVIQCLAKHSDFPVELALRRMGNITLFMLTDLLRAIKEGDVELLRAIPSRDDNVDKFYIFILRQLKMVMLGLLSPSDIGASDLRECLGLRLVIKSIERIADHVTNSAICMLEVEDMKKDIRSLLLKLGENVKRLYSDTLKAFFERNPILAHSVADKIEQIKEMESRLVEKVMVLASTRDAMYLRLVAESLRRIADYSTDISEITINLAIPGP
ncbi:MAG: hypothetical protein DRJ66_07300 [Thermoprotei archaeon]|nr:MAG: hypothetical protein DRJ66_07300 [Thermoprotei archaeon]RLF19358.1 MAG: hypothetical protein DRZ82_05935 [Thermoprotei archaeon]